MKDWECKQACEGLKGCYYGYNHIRTTSHRKNITAKINQGYKSNWEKLQFKSVTLAEKYVFVHKDVYLFYYLFIFKIFIYFSAVLGLYCCTRAFSSCGERGLLFIALCRLLTAVAYLVAEHGLQAHTFQQLQHAGSVVVVRQPQSVRASVVAARGLRCSAACGIFPDQGLNPCPLHWQVDS